MKRIKISKTTYYDVVNMYYNVYNVSIKVEFDGSLYYRRITFQIIANDEKDAKAVVNGWLAKTTDIAPVKFEDEAGWNKFVDALYAEQAKDELQTKYVHYK